MRLCLPWLAGLVFLGLLPRPLAAQNNVVQDFTGNGTTTTGFFTVKDRWEVRWNARQVVSVAVMSADGTIVAGAAGVLRGSLFVPLGGEYYLKITDGTTPPPPPVPPPAPSTTNSAPDTGTSNSTTTNSAPSAGTSNSTTTNSAPDAGTSNSTSNSTTSNAPAEASTTATNTAPAAATSNSSTAANNDDLTAPLLPDDTGIKSTPTPAPATPEISWHLQIIQMSPTVSSDQKLSVYAPYFTEPDSAVTPAPAPPPPPVLTNDQARSIVVVKGDNAQGFGFFVKMPDGSTCVATHLHLLAANPNMAVTTLMGEPITVVSIKGASDRDLALITIKDNHYTYLPFDADAATSAQNGDQVIIPDLSQQSDAITGVPARIIAMAPDRIDFDNRPGGGSEGSPVIYVRNGKVMAILTSGHPVDVTDTLARAWPGNPAPGTARIIPYFGLPLYGVANWETYDWNRFLAETSFLKKIHNDTRCLDSYLNGRPHWGRNSNPNGPPDNRFFLNSTAVQEANNSYKQLAHDSDQTQQTEAINELVSDLEGIADTDINSLQNGNYLYTYDQLWAEKELAYRKALKKELDDLSNNTVKLVDIVRSR